jgi:uncharacterized phiE125 gp8 family phage protein
MGISAVTTPQCEPVTLDEALAHCRISADTEDGIVAGYLISARTFAETFTRRPLIQRTYVYNVDFMWPRIPVQYPSPYLPVLMYRDRVDLPRDPVISIGSVQYIDSTGAVQVLDPSQYVAYLDEPVPYLEPPYGVVWPTPRTQPACITVRFDAGFGPGPSDVPEEIRQAMLLLIAYAYDNRGSAQFGGRGRGSAGDVTSSIVPAETPPGVVAKLSPYVSPRAFL